MPFFSEPYVLLVAGSPKGITEAHLEQLASNAGYVIAADSGADLARSSKVSLDYIIGDLDSISRDVLVFFQDIDTEFITADPHKDETDLELALDFIDRHGNLSSLPLVVTNVLGGRVDHELASLGVIARYHHLRPRIVEDDAVVFFLSSSFPELILTDRGVDIQEELGSVHQVDARHTIVSVIPLLGEAVVSETGLEWELDHACLLPLDTWGVSNCMKDSEARVNVHEGIAAVFLY